MKEGGKGADTGWETGFQPNDNIPSTSIKSSRETSNCERQDTPVNGPADRIYAHPHHSLASPSQPPIPHAIGPPASPCSRTGIADSDIPHPQPNRLVNPTHPLPFPAAANPPSGSPSGGLQLSVGRSVEPAIPLCQDRRRQAASVGQRQHDPTSAPPPEANQSGASGNDRPRFRHLRLCC